MTRSLHLPFLQLGRGLGTHLTGHSARVGQLYARLLINGSSNSLLQSSIEEPSKTNLTFISSSKLASDLHPPVWVKWIDQAGADCGIIITGFSHHQLQSKCTAAFAFCKGPSNWQLYWHLGAVMCKCFFFGKKGTVMFKDCPDRVCR